MKLWGHQKCSLYLLSKLNRNMFIQGLGVLEGTPRELPIPFPVSVVVYPEPQCSWSNAPWDHLAAAKGQRDFRADLMWIHLSAPWPDLTWMSHSLVCGPKGLLFFSLHSHSPYCPSIPTCEQKSVCLLWICRGVLLHIRENPGKVICVF